MQNANKKKTLEELTIKDNFMFGAVMVDEDNCKHFLEMVLGFEIESLVVSKEKSIVYHPEYKGVRLDVFAKDENRTRYNVEMQAFIRKSLGKRARYYHSQIDMELLAVGHEYEDMPNTYVIFICDFDPFGKGKYRYTFRNCCLETKVLELADGCESIFLSTKGENDNEVPRELVKFLQYVGSDLETSTYDYGDEYVRKLQNSVRQVKKSREMKERFMIWREMLSDERNEGRKEGRVEVGIETIFMLLESLGNIPEKLRERIMKEQDNNVLKQWIMLAAKSETIEEFIEKM